MAFFQETSISVLTNAMKINHCTLTTPVWMIASCLTNTDTSGTETSATTLVRTVGTSTGMVRAELTVITLCLVSTEMGNIIANIPHLLELANICIIIERLMKVACLHLFPRTNLAISSVISLVTPVTLI